jgi:Zinc finger C-x8-C-x5-C-x3-H type (and similar)
MMWQLHKLLVLSCTVLQGRSVALSYLLNSCCHTASLPLLTTCETPARIGHTHTLSVSCSGPGALKPREECKYYSAGHCRFGDDCSFAHGQQPAAAGGGSSSGTTGWGGVANGLSNGQSNGQQLNGFAPAAAPAVAPAAFGGGSNGAFGFTNNAFAPAPAAVVPVAQGAFTFGGASQAPAALPTAVDNAAAAMFGVAPTAKPANVRASAARTGPRGGRR